MAAEQGDTDKIGAPSASQTLSQALGGNLRRTANGNVDVLHAMGGWRGLIESAVPAVLFLVIFTITKNLNPALVTSLVAAGVFTVMRLVQRSQLMPSISGVVGVGVCAWSAHSTGDANNYYLPGFLTSGAYLAAFIVSVLMRWPLAGLLFGFMRNEGLKWRVNPGRLKAYILATWAVAAVMALRLLVQLPLYFAGATEALGTTRLLMGIPLYALGLWVAWRVSDPQENTAHTTVTNTAVEPAEGERPTRP